MARIGLHNLRHSYTGGGERDEDWALKHMDVQWEDGGAYALLGPSGCGKTTLLNIISGLLAPTEGTVTFDGQDVTHIPPDERNIAQVFQFPVVYDTMTVYDNLAFPLRNRGVDEASVDEGSGNCRDAGSGIDADEACLWVDRRWQTEDLPGPWFGAVGCECDHVR